MFRTKVTFKPDLRRFGMTHLDDDIIALLKKRVYDIAGTSPKGLKVRCHVICRWTLNLQVSLNGELLAVNTFNEYVKLFFEPETSQPLVYQKLNERFLFLHPSRISHFVFRWEVCFTVSDGHFQQVSFVNSICTIKGGQHVNYVTGCSCICLACYWLHSDQLTKKLQVLIQKKNKKLVVKPQHVKNHIWVQILKPNVTLVFGCLRSFSTQRLRIHLLTHKPKSTWLSRNKSLAPPATCPTTLSRKVIAAAFSLNIIYSSVMDSGVVENILSWAQFKEQKALKKSDGTKKSGRLTGIPKLEDANDAGSSF